MQPSEFYPDQIEKYLELEQKEHRTYQRLLPVRVVVFFILAAAVFYLFSFSPVIGFAALFAAIVAFAAIVIFHEKYKTRAAFFGRLKTINEDELHYAKGKFTGKPGGDQFAKDQHPYHNDLDIFGPFSLFQYIDRTATLNGASTLASWLSAPAEKKEIIARQEAATELSNLHKLRQHFQVYGKHSKEQPRELNQLLEWMDEAPQLLPNKLLRIIVILFPLITVALIILSFFLIPAIVPIAALAIHAFILRKYNPYIASTIEKAGHKKDLLNKYVHLFQLVEENHFDSQKLNTLREPAMASGGISKQLQSLKKLVNNLEIRFNIFGFLLLTLPFFWDFHVVISLEKWKQRNRQNFRKAFAAIAEMDALCSFGTLTFNHPEWCFAKIEEGAAAVTATNMGHLLIPAHKRVSNDFTIKKGHVMLITGSNMAGKSTFLRTVGVNLVLALAGAPVCASTFSTTPIKLFSSMRTTDALEENVSSLYAELKRLHLILEQVKQDDSTFFLIDEILKGTNSMDRHKGSLALLHQLLKHGGTGLITTHDLELAEQAKPLPDVSNYSFEVETEGDALDFDYKMRPGICRSFNATMLMRKMGIAVE